MKRSLRPCSTWLLIAALWLHHSAFGATKTPSREKNKGAAEKRVATPGKKNLSIEKAGLKKRQSSALSKKLIRSGGKRRNIVGNPLRKVALTPSTPSIARLAGLHTAPDPLDLVSTAVLVQDEQTGRILIEKNGDAALPIASITKLMTALVTLESGLSLTEIVELGDADMQLERYSRSRLRAGMTFTRAELLQLALMASENKAAQSLANHYPGGAAAFVRAMNAKAVALGMGQTQFVEPTGLSSSNVSSPKDLAKLVMAAAEHPLIQQFSTSTAQLVDSGGRLMHFHNTNRLVGNPEWQITLSKTGFISAAGRCLVMKTQIEGRSIVMVMLDATGSQARASDAERIKRWVATQRPWPVS